MRFREVERRFSNAGMMAKEIAADKSPVTKEDIEAVEKSVWDMLFADDFPEQIGGLTEAEKLPEQIG